MMKSGTGKSKSSPSAPIRGVPDCGNLAHKYLLEYDALFQAEPKPFDIENFVKSFLELDVVEAVMDLPFIKGFVVYMQMLLSIGDCCISVNPGTVILNQELEKGSTEWRYIMAHEAAHWILKRERPNYVASYYSCCKGFSERSDLLDTERISTYYADNSDADSEMMADSIANALLMPANVFLPYATDLMEKYGFCEHKILVGECPEEETKVITELANRFDVPEYSVRNYLYSFGMYDDNTLN